MVRLAVAVGEDVNLLNCTNIDTMEKLSKGIPFKGG
jgi:hypothetical protein